MFPSQLAHIVSLPSDAKQEARSGSIKALILKTLTAASEDEDAETLRVKQKAHLGPVKPEKLAIR